MANFCCPIESEPRTLKQGQLDQAREVAVDIIQKKKPHEASKIFVTGLKPVVSIKKMALLMVEETKKLKKGEDNSSEDYKSNLNNGTPPCQCSLNSSSPIIDSPYLSSIKEPLSAPF